MTTWKWKIGIGLVVVLVVGGVFYIARGRMMRIQDFDNCVGAGYPVSQTYPLKCTANGTVFLKEGSDPVEVAVENVVASFGAVMPLVSTSAPKKIAAQAIKDNYQHLVSPSLLAAWMRDPTKAPGRQVSSPWPDHIEITGTAQVGTTTYRVLGNVVEKTSNDTASSSIADEYAVTTTVAITGGNWMITDWESAQ